MFAGITGGSIEVNLNIIVSNRWLVMRKRPCGLKYLCKCDAKLIIEAAIDMLDKRRNKVF